MQSNREWFQNQLRAALNGLYSPPLLRKNPLVALLGLEHRRNPSLELQSVLLEAIEALRPTDRSPSQSEARRLYLILRRRYTEQVSQNQVAADLSLSIRQLQRKESDARDLLGDYLFKTYNVEEKIPAPLSESEEEPGQADPAPSRLQEMEYLKESVPSQEARLDQVIDDMLETITPLVQACAARIDYEPQEDLPPVYLQVPLLRQALINITGAVLWHAPGGTVSIRLESSAQTIAIQILGCPGEAPAAVPRDNPAEELRTAAELIDLCGGTLETAQGAARQAFSASICLPALEQSTVLVIDDNQDTLQLFRRYLAGTRYRFVGAHTASSGLAMAEEVCPQLVVLDVMMPEQDGWRMLSLLHQQMGTRPVPVVVCSILPQESLALALGATAFLRKPVSRAQFLAILERLLAR
jgi:CheY-like chemotaxis protein